MNSNRAAPRNTQKAASSASYENYQFDFGLPSTRTSSLRSLNDQKGRPQAAPFSSSSYSSSSSSSSRGLNKSTWMHQPSAAAASGSGLSSTASMVGDIFGKSWGSAGGSGSATGVSMSSNPNLFGDLVGSALRQPKSAGNVPLKDSVPKNSFSMGGLSSSLPKVNAPMNVNAVSAGNHSNYVNAGGSSAKGGSFSAPVVNSGASVDSRKDPFSSLGAFGSKASQPIGNSSAGRKNSSGDFSFEALHTAHKTGASNSSMTDSYFNSSNSGLFADMGESGVTRTQPFASQNPPPPPSSLDPLDSLFSSTTHSATADLPLNEELSGIDDWGVGSDMGGNNDAGGTIDLEGLSPPPFGVTASMAKSKGMDNLKQGQYADAIKWLSWAVVLLGKAGDDAGVVEVLSSRASCYKEVGEYKKAVADCSKVLEHDETNVSVLLQRALLYESSEKYKLGADDLRTVLKIDPSNRLARSTIHRLAKMSD